MDTRRSTANHVMDLLCTGCLGSQRGSSCCCKAYKGGGVFMLLQGIQGGGGGALRVAATLAIPHSTALNNPPKAA